MNYSPKLTTIMENTETNKQPYLSIAYDEADMAYGVRVIGLGENFVVALHDAKDGEEVTWDEACKLKAPTKKQAAIIIAILDELNTMLQEAGGDYLDSSDWFWTSTEYDKDCGWSYTCLDGAFGYGNKNCLSSVRPIFA